jgi:hypothetical protein
MNALRTDTELFGILGWHEDMYGGTRPNMVLSPGIIALISYELERNGMGHDLFVGYWDITKTWMVVHSFPFL